MSRVCGLFLFGVGIGLVIALIFPKTFFMVIMAAFCLLAGYNLFAAVKNKTLSLRTRSVLTSIRFLCSFYFTTS